MFRHKEKPADEQAPVEETKIEPSKEDVKEEPTEKYKAAPEEHLKELVEKNLKWSQIIYEQNRRINRKLFWVAFLSWFKFIFIVGSLVLAGWFFKPYAKMLMSQYGELLGIMSDDKTGGASQSSLEEMIKTLNLTPAQQERMKGLLK